MAELVLRDALAAGQGRQHQLAPAHAGRRDVVPEQVCTAAAGGLVGRGLPAREHR